ncbi:hypothetical protein GCM10020000_71800 [Streptomyces olivoverticillatus]
MAGPQSVLAYLQDAVRVPGPLLVWVTGHLMIPTRRSTELHLALRDSTPATVRYTGLPWQWLTRTLREHAGPTLLLIDAEADAHSWPHVTAAAHDGRLAEGLPLTGVVAPAAAKPPAGGRPYTRAFLTALSVGHPTAGPTLDPALLHQLALAQAGLPEGILALQYGGGGSVLANRAAVAPAPAPRARTGGGRCPAARGPRPPCRAS